MDANGKCDFDPTSHVPYRFFFLSRCRSKNRQNANGNYQKENLEIVPRFGSFFAGLSPRFLFRSSNIMDRLKSR